MNSVLCVEKEYKSYVENTKKIKEDVNEDIKGAANDKETLEKLYCLNKICDLLIDKNKVKAENDIPNRLVSGIKYFIIGILVYLCAKETYIEYIKKMYENDIIISVMITFALLMIIAGAFSFLSHIIESYRKDRVTKVLLKKMIIESKIEVIKESLKIQYKPIESGKTNEVLVNKTKVK